MGKMIEGMGKEKRTRDREWDSGKEKRRGGSFAEEDAMLRDWDGREDEGPFPTFYENVKKWKGEAREEGSPAPLFYENGMRWRG